MVETLPLRTGQKVQTPYFLQLHQPEEATEAVATPALLLPGKLVALADLVEVVALEVRLELAVLEIHRAHPQHRALVEKHQ